MVLAEGTACRHDVEACCHHCERANWAAILDPAALNRLLRTALVILRAFFYAAGPSVDCPASSGSHHKLLQRPLEKTVEQKVLVHWEAHMLFHA